jgi:hypothetical protein
MAFSTFSVRDHLGEPPGTVCDRRLPHAFGD